ncbi:MAG: hemolysin III family protein [Fidelibacterota bacterium]
MEVKKKYAHIQSRGEELANSISHGVALAGAIAVTPILIVVAVRRGSAIGIVAASVFGASMILMYLMSTLYHSLPESRAKRIFNLLDHSAIYILIAGTYTPFTLITLKGGWGWSMFGVIWGLAIAGIVFKLIARLKFPVLSTVFYVLMGWVVIIAIKPLLHQLPLGGLLWLGAGGLSYMTGVIFFATEKLPYNHLIWHLLVLAGTTFHFIAVIKYAI